KPLLRRQRRRRSPLRRRHAKSAILIARNRLRTEANAPQELTGGSCGVIAGSGDDDPSQVKSGKIDQDQGSKIEDRGSKIAVLAILHPLRLQQRPLQYGK